MCFRSVLLGILAGVWGMVLFACWLAYFTQRLS